jgi:hypothetical protein
VLKRVRSASTVRLPMRTLLQLRENAPPYRLTFINIFLGIGYDRLTVTEKDELAPALLHNLDQYPAAHRSICLRLVLKVPQSHASARVFVSGSVVAARLSFGVCMLAPCIQP